jgi:hypothetical protein
MDTKERKTPVQDTCPAPGSVCRTQKLAPGTAKGGKNRIRKTGINFKGLRKNFLTPFSSVNFALPLVKRGLATLPQPRRAGASAGDGLRSAGSDRPAVFLQCTITRRSLSIRKRQVSDRPGRTTQIGMAASFRIAIPTISKRRSVSATRTALRFLHLPSGPQVVGIPGLQARPLGDGTSIDTKILLAFRSVRPAGR